MATPNTTLTPRRVCPHSRRAASAAALSVVAALALAVTANAFAGGPDPLPDSPAGLPDAAASQASSDEASLEAATQQAATAIANATQNNVQNIVVIIRINSPGDDVISQSNTASAGAVGANTSTTQQEGGAGAPGDQAEPTASTSAPADETGGGGTRAAGTPPAPTPAQDAPPAATLPLRVATPGPERARPRVTAVGRPAGDPGDASRRAAGARTGSTPNHYAATSEAASRQAAEAAPRSASARSARKSRPTTVTPVPARLERAAARAGAGVPHFVSTLAPRPTLPGSSADEVDSISTAVLMTLLMVVLAILLGVGSTYVPAVRARAWR
jgi:hypothetical protein